MRRSPLTRGLSPGLEARQVYAIAERWKPHWRDRKTGYYVDLIQEAAALWEGLSQNHPFVDGNKRVAITVVAAFLKINDFRLEFDDLDAYRFIINLYETGQMRFANLEAWLRDHTAREEHAD
jgi:death on curing protein